MITILPDSPNIEAANEVLTAIEQGYAEVRQLLPELPADIDIWLINENPIPETGVSGFAYSPTIITIDFDSRFADKQLQRSALRATIFHEAYHLVQGHTGQESSAEYTSALDSALYEGVATIFERKYADTAEPYGDYSTTDEALLRTWQKQLSKITPEEFLANDGALWRQWAFYDSHDDQHWKLYKTGVWLVDQFLAKTDKDTLDIVNTPAKDLIV